MLASILAKYSKLLCIVTLLSVCGGTAAATTAVGTCRPDLAHFDNLNWVRQAKPGKGEWRNLKPFGTTQRVITPARTRLASHPEASLAWRRGNPPYEA